MPLLSCCGAGERNPMLIPDNFDELTMECRYPSDRSSQSRPVRCAMRGICAPPRTRGTHWSGGGGCKPTHIAIRKAIVPKSWSAVAALCPSSLPSTPPPPPSLDPCHRHPPSRCSPHPAHATMDALEHARTHTHAHAGAPLTYLRCMQAARTRCVQAARTRTRTCRCTHQHSGAAWRY